MSEAPERVRGRRAQAPTPGNPNNEVWAFRDFWDEGEEYIRADLAEANMRAAVERALEAAAKAVFTEADKPTLHGTDFELAYLRACQTIRAIPVEDILKDIQGE